MQVAPYANQEDETDCILSVAEVVRKNRRPILLDGCCRELGIMV